MNEPYFIWKEVISGEKEHIQITLQKMAKDFITKENKVCRNLHDYKNFLKFVENEIKNIIDDKLQKEIITWLFTNGVISRSSRIYHIDFE